MYEQYVDDVVHEPTQTGRDGFDLTVADVSEIVEPGRLDFGGGELEDAETAQHASAKRTLNDDYEWWTLDEGHYLLAYNESLTG